MLFSGSPPNFSRCLATRASSRSCSSGFRPAVAEDLAERDDPVVHPAAEGVEQGVAIDEVVLKGEQTDEQVAVGIDVSHGTGLLCTGLGRGRRVPDIGGRQMHPGSVGLSHGTMGSNQGRRGQGRWLQDGPLPSPEQLRAIRAVAALEQIGSPLACKLLEESAAGAPGIG